MSDAPYSSRIIKASALIADTRALLASWDFDLSVDENLSRARDENIFAKASRKRVDDILAIFRQRYFSQPGVGEALAVFANAPGHAQSLDRLLYFYSARNDRLLHDVVTEVLAPRHQIGLNDLPTAEIQRAIRTWVAEGKATRPWNDETVERVSQGVQATLRDFGILEGKAHKRIASVALPVEAGVFIAFVLFREQQTGERLRIDPEWRLFFMNDTAVERLLMEAHQRHLIEYHAAGRVVRIDFPSDDIVEVARALTR